MSFPKHERQFFAWAQQIGASTTPETQQDRVRMEFVRTLQRKKVFLAVIADGEHHPDAGRAAESLVSQIFHQFKRQAGDDLSLQLAHAFKLAGDIIKGNGAHVAATAIIIHRNRLYFAHAGHTAGFLIRSGKMIPFTRPSKTLLAMPSVEIQQGDAQGIKLQPGDHIMLATDGLLRASPEDGRPFVDPQSIPAHIEGNSPEDAARHLVSLAMGRDVDDNVTVAVLQVPGEERRSFPWVKWLALLGGVAALIALMRFLPSMLDAEPALPPTDYGYAVLIEGSALVETEGGTSIPAQRLEAVAPLARILSQEAARFVLQSNADASSELPNASIYLGPESSAVLSLIDAGANLPEGHRDLSDRTKIELDSGAILILRTSGSWTYQVDFHGSSASLAGSGYGAMGVACSESGIEVDCLFGTCQVIAGKDGPVVLQNGLGLSLLDGAIVEKRLVSSQRIAAWNEICKNCLAE